MTLLANFFSFFRYPWHASCKIKWEIEESCQEFKTKIINQISEWEVSTERVYYKVEKRINFGIDFLTQ